MESYQALEREFAQWNELDPAGMVVCNSGTSALHLALEAMRLPKASEVLVPEFTMVACARAVILAELKPLFVDCSDELVISTKLVEGHCHRYSPYSPKVVMPVHIYGLQCNMYALGEIANTYSLIVVEDLAEAHGIKPDKGTDAACWSFYRNKIICGEEGGAVWFRNPEHAALARQLRTLGFQDTHNYLHVPRGHNYRLSNVHADLIRKSLANADENIKKRRFIESWYTEWLEDEDFDLGPATQAPWMYAMRLVGYDTTKIVQTLNRQYRIEARLGFKPMSEQPEFRREGFEELNAYRLSRQVIYMPIRADMSFEEVKENCRALIEVAKYSKLDTRQV
jgi:dTDP-4-amino-4,6-dideoxygalactose transaminase